MCPDVPEQATAGPVNKGMGNGLMVMVYDSGGPSHVTFPEVKWGMTVTEATTGTMPVLIPVKELMFPLPEAARPMEGVSLIQV
jgi:hypothetical protein